MANNIEVDTIRTESRHTREWTRAFSSGWRDHVQDLSADNTRWTALLDIIEKNVNAFITSSSASEKANALEQITKSIATARDYIDHSNAYLGFLFDKLTKVINVSSSSINKLDKTSTIEEIGQENERYLDLIVAIHQDHISKVQEYFKRKQEESNNG